MIPDSFYAPLIIIGGLLLIALSIFHWRRGSKEGAYVRIGRVLIALFMIGFGVLLGFATHAPH